MRSFNRWILPVLTGLVVLSAVLLPPRLSRIRDGRLLNQVHSEALTAENGLTALPPALEERMLLLARWQEDGTGLAVANQPLESPDALEELVRAELQSLTSQGALSPELLPESPSSFNSWRMVLQDVETGAGASFLVADRYEKEQTFWLILDEESGRLLRMDIREPQMKAVQPDPAALGGAFLGRLGTDCTLLGAGPHEALFQITGTDLQYLSIVDGFFLSVRPTGLEQDGASIALTAGAATE